MGPDQCFPQTVIVPIVMKRWGGAQSSDKAQPQSRFRTRRAGQPPLPAGPWGVRDSRPSANAGRVMYRHSGGLPGRRAENAYTDFFRSRNPMTPIAVPNSQAPPGNGTGARFATNASFWPCGL